MRKQRIWWAVILLTLVSTASSALNFTADQIAQFQKLPVAQQRALARQFGVDLSNLPSDLGNIDSQTSSQKNQTIQPRQVEPSQGNLTSNDQHEQLRPTNGLIDFGYALFAGLPSSYTPVDDLPVPNNYLIAPGDEIDVQLFGSQNRSFSLNVSRDGTIQFPELGPIHVAGQTFSELKNNLTSRIKNQILGVDVSISLGSLRTMQVYVTGDVYQPGAYNVPSLATVTQALIAAGGFRKTGSLRHISIRRNNEVIERLDLYDLLLRGETRHDIRLQSGDTVFVAARGPVVAVRGQVRRPARYEINDGETLGQLIKDAGGSRANAYLQQVEVRRYQDQGVKVHTLDLTQTSGKAFTLQNGDRIRLLPVSDELKNAIVVRGAANRQGVYAYRQGMHITDLFGSSIDDALMPNVDLTYALVVREIDAERNISVLQFNIGEALNNPDSADNLTLQKGDQIFVFATDLTLKDWQAPSYRSLSEQVANSSRGKVATEDNNRIDPTTGVEVVNSDRQELTASNSEANNSQQQQQDPDSRAVLLKPLLQRLKQQAVNGKRVKIYEVSGSVRYPGIYPLVDGATLRTALVAAGGLLESAAKDQAELSRAVIMPGAVSLNHQVFDLSRVLTEPDGDFTLQSKDRIDIQRKTNWTTNNVVEIQGEVRHPGNYTINQGETIADLVARAGGLTQYAYPQGSIFSREILRQQEQQRMSMMANNLRQEIASLALRRQSSSATYTTSPTEALNVVNDLNTMPAVGRLVINLPQILRGNEHSDVMLEGGDKLYIPPQRDTVSVLGQVQMASNFTFDPSKSVEQYIDMAGGEKKQADVDRIYVIRSNGAVMLPNQSYWFKRSDKSLEPGDTIIVPIDTDYLDGLSTMSTATQIMYQIGVAWNAIN